MPVFHLFPRPDTQDDLSWEATTLRAGCWIVAEDEMTARQKVAYATNIAVEMKPGQLVRTSPWKNPALTDCVLDERPPGVGQGVIYTEAGETITVRT